MNNTVDVSLVLVPLGVSSPRPNSDERRNVLYAISDVILLSQEPFVLELQSASAEHRPTWFTPNENKGQSPAPWTTLSSTEGNPVVQVSGSLRLLPLLPVEPILTDRDLLGNTAQRLAAFRLQVRRNNLVYRSDFLNGKKRVEEIPEIKIQIGPVLEVQGITQRTLAFVVYRMTLTLSVVSNPEPTNIWTLSDPAFSLAPRFQGGLGTPSSSSPTPITSMQDLDSILVLRQSKSILNRQRNISERAFWKSRSSIDPLNPDPVYLVPLLLPSVPRPLDTTTLPYSWYQVALRRLLVRLFLLHFTSNALPLIRDVRQRHVVSEEQGEESDVQVAGETIVLAPYWIRPEGVLCPSTRCTTFLPLDLGKGDQIPTVSVLSYVYVQALMFVQSTFNVPAISRRVFLQYFNEEVINAMYGDNGNSGGASRLQIDQLSEIFNRVNARYRSGANKIPRREIISLSTLAPATERTDLQPWWYLMATHTPWFETGTIWNRPAFPWRRIEGQVIENRNDGEVQMTSSPTLLVLMKYAWDLVGEMYLDPATPNDSNFGTMLRERRDYNRFNAVTYQFEDNLYWEACNNYDLVLRN